MKYMTFNSSCSYAGIANLLAFYGIETTDREIAVDMGLPYFFDYNDGCYLSGSMLQNAKWFNIYLKPLGFTLTERELRKEQVCNYLSDLSYAMLGIHAGNDSKHAVVYTGKNNDKYCFLNNKWERSDEPERFELSEQELILRLDNIVMIAVLTETQREAVSTQKQLQSSRRNLQALQKDIDIFCSQERSSDDIKRSMKTLFRAILLDSITMLELIGKTSLSQKLKTVQNRFLNAVKENRPLQLNQYLDMSLLDCAIREYIALIDSRLNQAAAVDCD